MAKVYIANTPLILENEQGDQFRVEVGEAVELTAEQYVTPTLTTGEELDAQQNDTPPSEDTPSDDAGTAGEVEKPKRGKKPAAAEEAE